MEKTTGTAKVTMEAFGEKIEQTGSAVIAFVIKPDGREEGTMSMAMGGQASETSLQRLRMEYRACSSRCAETTTMHTERENFL